MTKKILLLSVAVLLSLAANAQLRLGVRGGLDLTNYTGEGTFVEKMKGSTQTGYYLGPTIKYCPVSFVGVDVSALFEQRSVEIADVSLKQQSILFPLNMRIQFVCGDLLTISTFGGPQIGFNLSRDKNISYADQMKKWEWNMSNLSGNVGVGVLIFERLEITACYNLGLGKTGEFKREKLETAIDDLNETRFHSWQLGLAMYF